MRSNNVSNNKRKKRAGKQGMMPFAKARKRPGPKPKATSGVSHTRRPDVDPKHPMLITMKLKRGLPTLRSRAEFDVIRDVFRAAKKHEGFRTWHLSVQGDHVHLLCESDDRASVSRVMQGIMISLARRLNRLWNRTGKVFLDRYHRVDKRSPREVRNAIRYVLMNARKHRPRETRYDVCVTNAKGEVIQRTTTVLDPFSTAHQVKAWLEPFVYDPIVAESPIVKPKSWLARDGWHQRGGGLLSIHSSPSAA